MTDGSPLDRADEALRSGALSVTEVLDKYGQRLVHEGQVFELRDVLERSSAGGGQILGDWIARTCVNGNHSDAERECPEDTNGLCNLADVDLINMADWLKDPDMLTPPESVAEGMIYRGQTTLLYADPKSGKTTVAISLGAAVSAGSSWLSQPTSQGRVLYLAAEGSRPQLLRRLHEFGAAPKAVDVVVPAADPVDELRFLLDVRQYQLVVIDTLGKWMSPLDIDRWKQSDVDTVLTPLERIIRASGSALLAIHHANTKGKPIGSTGFEAWADVLRKIEDGGTERERVVTGRARFEVPDLRFQLREDGEGPRLVSINPNRSTEEEIWAYIDSNQNCSKSQIRDGVSGSRVVIDDHLDSLVENGIVERDTSGRSHKHRIAKPLPRHGPATVRHARRHGGAGDEGAIEADRSPPTHMGGGTSATVAEPADSANRCKCGKKIGASATTCGECRAKQEDQS